MRRVDHILGQHLAVDILQSALRGGRLHHAYVFHGPVGVGKFTTARAFAAVLLCPQPVAEPNEPVRPCGRCPACVQVQQGSHPDDHLITKELARFSGDANVRQRKLTTIPIDVLRQNMLEPVQLAATLGHTKVFTVDEAQLIAEPAQNLLLKTLEEPPPNTYIILVTDSEHRLLPTIRSRCQRVPFVPLPDKVIADWRSGQARLDPHHERWLIAFAGGSLGQAQLAADRGLYEWAKVVLPALDAMARQQHPHALGGQMAGFIDEFAKSWVQDNEGASKDAANRRASALLFSMIGQHARLRLRELADQSDGADTDAAEAAIEPWLRAIDALGEAQRHLSSNVNLGLVLDHLVSRLFRALSAGEAVAVL